MICLNIWFEKLVIQIWLITRVKELNLFKKKIQFFKKSNLINILEVGVSFLIKKSLMHNVQVFDSEIWAMQSMQFRFELSFFPVIATYEIEFTFRIPKKLSSSPRSVFDCLILDTAHESELEQHWLLQANLIGDHAVYSRHISSYITQHKRHIFVQE